MASPSLLPAALAEFSRSAVTVGIAACAQIALLGVVGGLAARSLRHRGPSAESLAYRLALAASCLVVILDAAGVSPMHTFWRLSLPAADSGSDVRPRDARLVDEISDHPRGPQSNAPTESGGADATLAKSEGPFASARYALTAAAEGVPLATPQEASASPSAPITVLPTPVEAPGAPPPSLIAARAYISAVAVYALGLLASVLWLLACGIGLRRLCAFGTPCAGGTAAETLDALCDTLQMPAPSLRLHPTAPTPFLTGIARPTIFMPSALETDVDPVALRAILAHELTHLRRRDCAWRLLARAVTVVLWFHPLTWLLRRWMDEADEGACDQAAVDLGCPAATYAGCLVRLAETYATGGMPRATEARIAAFRSTLGRRVERILRASGRTRPAGLRTRAALGLGGLVSPLAALAVVSGARPAAYPKRYGAETSHTSGAILAPATTPMLSDVSFAWPDVQTSVQARADFTPTKSPSLAIAQLKEREMKMRACAPALLGALIGTTVPAAVPAQQSHMRRMMRGNGAFSHTDYWRPSAPYERWGVEFREGGGFGEFGHRDDLIWWSPAPTVYRADMLLDEATEIEMDMTVAQVKQVDEVRCSTPDIADFLKPFVASARPRFPAAEVQVVDNVPAQDASPGHTRRARRYMQILPAGSSAPNVPPNAGAPPEVGVTGIQPPTPASLSADHGTPRTLTHTEQVRQSGEALSDGWRARVDVNGLSKEGNQEISKIMLSRVKATEQTEYYAMAKILHASQFRRWKQICLQLAGPEGLANPRVADDLALTTSQRKVIGAAYIAWRDYAPKSEPTTPQERAALDAIYKQNYMTMRKAILGALTPGQRVRLRLMAGRTFKRPETYIDEYWS